MPEKKAILALYSGSPSKPSLLIQPNGEYKRSIFTDCKLQLTLYLGLNIISGGLTDNFQFQMDDDTEVYGSCSASLNGELYVLGGNDIGRRQVKFSLDLNFFILNFRFPKLLIAD